MPQIGGFQIDPWLIIIGTIFSIGFIAISVIWGIRAHQLKVAAGREELIGRTAEVRVALNPRGIVFIEGEQWTATSESGRVEPGEEVIISKVDGLKLYV
ncbi:MAG: NfeD family protein, partial [Dehalococcoidales bacterium]|nr:NfeD family protein [Dehalococcoidales bacterium]